MDSEEFATERGKQELGSLLFEFRNALGITTWQDLAKELGDKAGYTISHDQLWKIHKGYYKAPSFKILYACTRYKEFSTPDGRRLTLDLIGQILTGETSVFDDNPGS